MINLGIEVLQDECDGVRVAWMACGAVIQHYSRDGYINVIGTWKRA